MNFSSVPTSTTSNFLTFTFDAAPTSSAFLKKFEEKLSTLKKEGIAIGKSGFSHTSPLTQMLRALVPLEKPQRKEKVPSKGERSADELLANTKVKVPKTEREKPRKEHLQKGEDLARKEGGGYRKEGYASGGSRYGAGCEEDSNASIYSGFGMDKQMYLNPLRERSNSGHRDKHYSSSGGNEKFISTAP